jgi:hypothetical protein
MKTKCLLLREGIIAYYNVASNYTKKYCKRFLPSVLQFIDFVKNLQFQVVFLKNQRTFDETS